MRGPTEVVLPAAVAIAPLACGAMVAVVGVLGWRGRLPRNRLAGIRTPATMASDEAFEAANRAGGLLISLGGSTAVLGGVASLTLHAVHADAAAWICALGGVLVMAVLAVVGGVVGVRAARMGSPAK